MQTKAYGVRMPRTHFVSFAHNAGKELTFWRIRVGKAKDQCKEDLIKLHCTEVLEKPINSHCPIKLVFFKILRNYSMFFSLSFWKDF